MYTVWFCTCETNIVTYQARERTVTWLPYQQPLLETLTSSMCVKWTTICTSGEPNQPEWVTELLSVPHPYSWWLICPLATVCLLILPSCLTTSAELMNWCWHCTESSETELAVYWIIWNRAGTVLNHLKQCWHCTESSETVLAVYWIILINQSINQSICLFDKEGQCTIMNIKM